MNHLTFLRVTVASLLLGTSPAGVADCAPATRLYAITRSIPLGAPDRWDYLTYDAGSHRIFVAHGATIDVLDGRSGTALGKVEIHGSNGVAVIPALGKGYAGSREDKSVVVFDLQKLTSLRSLPADEDTDGLVYDPFSKRIFVMEGDPHKALVVDTRTDTVVGRVSLSGQPEFAVADEKGHLFVNIEDQRTIQRVNTHTLMVDATWSIPECEAPHGLAIDPVAKRLFSSCTNALMVIVDATTGTVVQSVPIGKGTDAVAFDAQRKRVFSSNGLAGTVTVVSEESSDRFELLGENPTQPMARTMAVDPEMGRLFLVSADRIEVDPTASSPRKRYAVRAGSVRLLFMDPMR